MAITGVAVRWKDQDYLCMAVPDARLGIKFKCGKCCRGVVPPFMGEKCLLCGAEVSIVDYRKTRGDWAKNGFYGTATMRSESFWDEFNIPPSPSAERKSPDLEAIRARREHLRLSLVRTSEHFEQGAYELRYNAITDIDALLAEVERLREVLVIAFPNAIDRAYIDAAPDAVRKYLARGNHSST